MAEAKKKAPAKKVQTPQEKLAELRATYGEQRRSHAAGELVNPQALKQTRKAIARTLTEINNKESK